jgi:PST family polysaccharide transporter
LTHLHQFGSPDGAPVSSLSVFAGVRWTGIGHVAGQLTRFAVSLVLARLLAPEDFGLLGMAVVITGFVGLFQTLGTHGAVIQRKELSAAFVNSVGTLNVMVGAVLTCVLVAAAPVVSGIYGTSDVAPVIQLLAASFVIMSFGTIHSSALNRKMRFGQLVAIELTATVLQAVTAIALAAAGWKVWALATANLVSAVVTTGLLVALSPWRIRCALDWSELRPVMGFSVHLTGVNIVEYAFKNLDKLIIGSLLGADALGYYWLAYSLCMLPAEALTRILGRVLFAAFSRMQDDDAELRRAVFRTLGLTVLVIAPTMAGLAAVAGPFVVGVIGEKWAPIVPLVALLVTVGALQAIASPVANVYLAKGKSQWLFWWNVGSGIVIVASFFVGVQWGLVGLAAAYAIVTVPLTVGFLLMPFRLIRLDVGDVLASVTPIAAATAVMVATVLGVRVILETAGYTARQVLAVTVPVGIVSYAVIIVAGRPRSLGDLVRVAGTTSAIPCAAEAPWRRALRRVSSQPPR